MNFSNNWSNKSRNSLNILENQKKKDLNIVENVY